jgi:hypothetical protein
LISIFALSLVAIIALASARVPDQRCAHVFEQIESGGRTGLNRKQAGAAATHGGDCKERGEREKER